MISGPGFSIETDSMINIKRLFEKLDIITFRTGVVVWVTLILIAVIGTVATHYRLQSYSTDEIGQNREEGLFGLIFGWTSIIALFVVPVFGFIVGLVAVFRVRTQTKFSAIGLLLNLSCILIFLFLVYLTMGL